MRPLEWPLDSNSGSSRLRLRLWSPKPDSAIVPMYTITAEVSRALTLSATFRLLAAVQVAVGRSPGLQKAPLGTPGVGAEAAIGGTEGLRHDRSFPGEASNPSARRGAGHGATTRRRSGPQSLEFHVGKKTRARDKSNAFGRFQRKTVAALPRDVDDNLAA